MRRKGVDGGDTSTGSSRWSWARLLERVFDLDMATCPLCRRGSLRIIAAITHEVVITRMSIHKGKITMLGRIMAGSQAVMAHDDAGQALFGAYYPPDIHLSQVIVAYCQRVALATGSSLFGIDRAVNAVAMASAVDDQGLGLLCMLDDNEHAGLESFEATEVDLHADGTRVYRGPWKEPRPDEPRHCKREKLEQSLAAAQQRVDKQAEALKAQQDKVAASASTGHGTRLAQRQRALVGVENALLAFMGGLCEQLQTKVSLDGILRLLFARSGARLETVSQVVYWVNTAGVSLPYRRLLIEVVEGLCAMELKDQGKPIRVCLKDMPP